MEQWQKCGGTVVEVWWNSSGSVVEQWQKTRGLLWIYGAGLRGNNGEVQRSRMLEVQMEMSELWRTRVSEVWSAGFVNVKGSGDLEGSGGPEY